MMHVLSIIHYPVFGGPHNRNVHVAPHLEAFGVTTTVLLPNEPGNAEVRLKNAGINVVSIQLSRIRATLNPILHLRYVAQFIGDVKRIRRVIREKQIDVVQINGLVNPQGALAARLEGVPVVWQILDTYSPMALRHLVMPVVSWLASVVMCTGLRVAEEHPWAIGFGERLVLFYPPVNLGRFTMSPLNRQHARNTLGLPQDAFVIGSVGNINPQKGHLTFIRAAASLKKKIQNARFVILGATYNNHRQYADMLWREASALGLSLGADLLVVEPGSNVAELESAFDVFWMTSEPRSEGIPTSVEEAMALGIPVVSTKVGSISEIVEEGRTGFVVDSYDIEGIAECTYRLYVDIECKQSMGRAASDYAKERFGVANCARSHLVAYNMAIGGQDDS